MEYRLLKNGQKISTIGIGVGNYGYANVPLAEIEKIFHTAFDGGVNFFDTCMSASCFSRPTSPAWAFIRVPVRVW